LRHLATIETITAINPIPDADNIEALTIRNWTVVSQKGNFHAGDPCVYFEIDSFLPYTDKRYEFLRPRGVKTFEDTEGHVLRTAKLRGVYSQGLALPLQEFPELSDHKVSDDVTEILGIKKYEPPIPAEISGITLGAYPLRFAKKTDAERIQNITQENYLELLNHKWTATEKIDGTSCTIINDDGNIRVCGRNWEYARNDSSTLWRLASQIAPNIQPGYTIQGEVYGEGIQGNPLNIRGQRFSMFAYVAARQPLGIETWPEWTEDWAVPILWTGELPDTIEQLLNDVDGLRSRINPDRRAEGIVFHHEHGLGFDFLDDRSCFKVISNSYLAKQKDQ
jgi:RNA ligase (TIGR02306 family)